jgi:hypothetical protein
VGDRVIPHALRIANGTRGARGFYTADLLAGDVKVGHVTRAARGGGGYRATEYHARMGRLAVAVGPTLADLREQLREVDPADIGAQVHERMAAQRDRMTPR